MTWFESFQKYERYMMQRERVWEASMEAEGFIGRAGGTATPPRTSRVQLELNAIAVAVEHLVGLDAKARVRVMTYLQGLMEEMD